MIKDKASGDPVDGYDLDDLDFHSAVYLNGQISDGNLTADEDDLEKIAAALEKGEPDYSFAKKESKSKGYKKEVVEEKAFVPTTKAESSKQGDIQPYLNLIDHLSGEEKKGVLSGGHLLSDMKKKYPNLLISGETNDDSPWEGWWSDGKANPKWSSFFPASWTRNSLVEQLWGSSQCKGGRLFKCGIAISKTGDTFYPWVSQTLTAAPKLTDMKKA
ncbi:hypothetical protein NM04_17325 [Massilia aurea]|uniref:Uncharacterized protein n=1 Tax=Massilia aurea TaxID=373040 RepID=A0A422QHS8_9BURK|nr:hypothetical protein NM04_17325 [Massilia aurea]